MKQQSKLTFSKAFWVANVAELLERAAYYGVFVVITLYLSNILGFSDIAAALISGCYSAFLYLLPTFTGAMADKIGFRRSMLIAFSFLTVGYIGLAIFPTLLESSGLVSYGVQTHFTGLIESGRKWGIVPILIILVFGGSIIKSVISGSVARETDTQNRARGFAIFYAMVNIGSFAGKTVIDPLRYSMGDRGMIVLNYFSAVMTVIALLAIFFLYRSDHHQGEGKSIRDICKSLLAACRKGRLVALILIVSGFWIVYYQLYATMPKYVIRLAGEGSTIGWYTLVNPLVVVLTVNFMTSLLKRRTALFSMTLGMLVIPFSAMLMASGNLFTVDRICGLHPVAFMMIVGIVFQALAETMISPRYLEYFSLQSPKGEEGMYLGFAQLDTFVSSLVGFGLSGVLLEHYCPDPKRFATVAEWEAASAHAHYIWYYFAAIALCAAAALIIYGVIVRRIDKRKMASEIQIQN